MIPQLNTDEPASIFWLCWAINYMSQAGRVNPRLHINTLSVLLMIYSRLCSAAGAGRRGWEPACFSRATAATLALCGLLVNWLWVNAVPSELVQKCNYSSGFSGGKTEGATSSTPQILQILIIQLILG